MSSTKTEQVQKAPIQASREQKGKVVVPALDEQNKQIEVPISLAAKVQLDFDPGTANAERVHNNLVFTFDDGKKVTLVDFFVTGGNPLPALELPGGAEVASAQILAALNPDMDLTTAAGPGVKSGGTNYVDDPGNLLGGIERLGSLGTDQWGNTTDTPLVEPTIRLLPGDGDIVTGTINVSVNDRGIIITGLDAGKELSAFEKHLDIVQDGSPYEGTHDDDAVTWTQAKTFTFTTGDGFSGLTIGGVNVPLSASSLDIAGNHGTLRIMDIVQSGDTCTVTYRYHLTENADHSSGSVKDSFGVQVTDLGAETRSASLDVAIVDDKPVPTDDMVHLGLNTLSVSGSVLTGVVAGTLVPSGDADKYGADGPAAEGSLRFHDDSIRFTSALGGVEPLTYDETTHLLTDSLGNAYGTLELNSDGTYSYTRPAGIEHEGALAVQYTIIDGDGDTSGATLSIDVGKLVPTMSVGASDLTVHEDGLAGVGTHAGDPAHPVTHEGLLAVSSAETPATIEVGGLVLNLGAVDGSGNVAFTNSGTESVPNGNFSVTSIVKSGDVYTLHYSYTLTDHAAHPIPGASETADSTALPLTITVTDATGDFVSGSFVINILDDAPTLTVTDTVDTVTGTDPVTVGTWAHAFGADQPLDAAANIAVSLDGTHYVTGAFVPASGSVGAYYSFNVAGDTIRLYTNHDVTFQSGTDRAESDVTLHIKVTDADGDTAGATAIQFDLEPSRLVLADIGTNVQESALGPNVGVGGLPGTNPDSTDEYSNSGAWVKLFTPAEILAGITVDKAALEAHYGSGVIESGNFLIIAGAYGELKINLADQTYRYELTHAAMHDTATPGSGAGLEKDNAETFTLFARDASGKTGDLSLTVDIRDDAPVLDVQGTGIHNLGANANFVFSATGSVTLNYGADGPDDPHGATVPVRLNWFNDKVTGTDITGSGSVDVPLDGSWVSVNTAMGVLSLSYNNNVLQYSYLAKRGEVNDNEQITLSVTDGDKDIATDNINFHLLYKVPAGTVALDEAGITGLGSHHEGFAPSTGTFSLDAGQIHPGTTSITWHTGTVSSTLMADSDDNGTYEAVTWTQVGNTLLGHAGGVLVMQVVPEFVSGTFTGNFSAELFKPVQHATGADALGLLVGLKQNTGSGGGLETAIGITVMDDRPEAKIEPVVTQEAIVAQENVYLVIDDSGSMNQSEVQQELNAFKGLVQKYIDLGIDARFTYVEFATSATVLTGMDGLTAAQMLAKLNAITATAGSGNTNYRAAVNLTMSQMAEDLTNPDLHSMKKTVYFVSDGEPTVGSGSDGWVPDAWNQYVKDNNVNVVALGVGIAPGGLVNLQDVASTTLVPTNQAILVDNFSNLLAALTGTVTSTANGNILGVDTNNNDTRSADHTTVDAVNVSGTWVTVAAGSGGTTIDLGNGIHLTLWQNGDYKISSSQNLSAVVALNLEYRIKDADGDTSENSLSIIVKDSTPQAFDNAGIMVTETVTPAHQNLEVFTGSSLTGAGWTVYGSAASNQVPPSTLPDIAGTSDSANRTVALTANGGNLNTTGVLGTATVQSVVGTTSTDGAAITKSFTLGSAGEIRFNWLLQNGRNGSNYDRDAGFWVLKNAGGAVVQTGLLAQAGNQQYYSGTQTIAVGAAGTYTLVLAVVDIPNGATDRRDAMLYVDDIIFAPAAYSVYKYEGNVIDDPGVDGSVDVMADHAKLHSFDYAGQTYVFDGTASSITTIDGKFTMTNVGDYTFKDSRADIDDVNISYTLKDQDGDTDSGMLFIRSSTHMFMGTAGNDTIDGSLHTANNLYSGGAGNDLITGGSGHDALYGGAGHDTLIGGAGHDRLVGGEGNDFLMGGIGNDTLYGGAGNDTLDGGVGNDLLRGGAGNNVLHGGTGNDTMMGGTGADTFEWGTGDLRTGTGNLAVVQDFTLGEDRLHFQDILGSAEPTMTDVLTKLRLAAGNDDKMDITVNGTHEAVVTIGNDTVQVNLEGAGLSAATVTAIDSGDEDAKAQLLLHLLTTN